MASHQMASHPSANDRGAGSVLRTWVVVYPLLTILTMVIEPALFGAPVPVRTLVTSAVMVPTLVCYVHPWVLRRWPRCRARP